MCPSESPRPSLVVPVADLIGDLSRTRPFAGDVAATLRLGESTVDGEVDAHGVVTGLIDGVIAEFEASAVAKLQCVRCLRQWEQRLVVRASQAFTRHPDEDGYRIIESTIDLSRPVVDEVALAIPAVPLCRPDCRGLCPTCGTDLNTDPCAGHDEEPLSPFSALKDLFDP